MVTNTLTGFDAFWQQVLTYGAPALQMVLWIIQGVAIIIALRLLRRYVEARTAAMDARTAAIAPEAPADTAGLAARISIEEFVE